MVANPFGTPLFAATLWRLALAFSVLLILAIWHKRGRRHGIRDSVPLAKLVSTAWTAPVLLVSLFGGFIMLVAAIALTMLQALREYITLAGLGREYGALLIVYSIAGAATAVSRLWLVLFMLPLGLFLLATLVPILTSRVADAHRQVSGTVFGYVYIATPLSFILFARETDPWGLRFLIIVCTATALADAGGLFVGSSLRGPKLAPKVSPAKTWSGALGTLAGALAGVSLQWPIAPRGWPIPVFILMVIAVAIGAIWGDLIESFIKRDFGVKDSGTILLGSGGILDRFDSVFLAFPTAYTIVLLVH
jgi:phosphatidate cytidylyltransferase